MNWLTYAWMNSSRRFGGETAFEGVDDKTSQKKGWMVFSDGSQNFIMIKITGCFHPDDPRKPPLVEVLRDWGLKSRGDPKTCS